MNKNTFTPRSQILHHVKIPEIKFPEIKIIFFLQGEQEKFHHGRENKKNFTMANLKFGENDIQSTVKDVIFLKLVKI